MGTTSIRVSEALKRRLDLYKREGESYEDVLRRLTERDQWAGFGVLSDTAEETRSGLRRVREAMREGTTADVDEMGPRDDRSG